LMQKGSFRLNRLYSALPPGRLSLDISTAMRASQQKK
jgi:hypothetical protein